MSISRDPCGHAHRRILDWNTDIPRETAGFILVRVRHQRRGLARIRGRRTTEVFSQEVYNRDGCARRIIRAHARQGVRHADALTAIASAKIRRSDAFCCRHKVARADVIGTRCKRS